jgi:hypothetical protein
MAFDLLRKVAMLGLLAFIVGGLWLLARWKAELSQPATIFATPALGMHPPAQVLTPASDDSTAASFDQVLLEDDEVVRVG